MDAIHIPQLTKSPERSVTIQFEEFLPDLETLTPVKGCLRIKHQGNYLEVSAQAETIITLACHRCLQNYNHRLSIKTSELIWLDESADPVAPLETEINFEDLEESLPPRGHFHPDDWLYQQLCLAIPQRQLCQQDCSGIEIQDSSQSIQTQIRDRRWESLEVLKRQLSS